VEFAEDGDTLSHLVREFPNALILRTFSKAYGLAGMRLGYAVSHPVLTRLLGRVKLPWNINGLTVAAAIAVLEDTEEFEARMSRLRQGRDYLVRELGRIQGLEVIPSEGNFVLVDVGGAGIRADAVVTAMLSEGVLIRLLAAHHAARSYVRVTVGDEAQNTRCVEGMRKVVNRLSRPAQTSLEATLPSHFDAE
jgi:histidinol-phosphate aminotransferase